MNIKIRNSLPQILAVMIKNLLMISFGMGLGFRTVLIGGVLTEKDPQFQNVQESEVSWLGSALLLAVVIGSLFSGFVTHPIGRKRSMQIVAIPYIICWIIYYFSNKIWHLYFALSVMGLFSGFVEGPFSTYVSEVTQPHLRGVLASSGSMAVVLGIFTQFLLGSLYNWRTCALISCIFPTLTFILFFVIPESPYWLLANNKVNEARKGLAWLRGWTTVDKIEQEMQDIIKHNETLNKAANEQKTESSSISKFMEYYVHFKKKSFLWPFALLAFLFIISHFTGATALQTYAIAIFATLKVPINVYNATVFLGLAQVIGSLINIFLIRFLGKRRLFFISVTGVCICNIIVATYALKTDAMHLNLSKTNEITSNIDLNNYKWIPLIFLILISFFDYCGVHAVPWVLVAEVYSYETRAVGTGVSSAVGSFLSFSSNKLFLFTVSAITLPGTYYFQSAIGIIGIIVAYFYLPETEGKSLELITSHFAETSTLDNNVQRTQTQLLFDGHNNLVFERDNSDTRSKQDSQL